MINILQSNITKIFNIWTEKRIFKFTFKIYKEIAIIKNNYVGPPYGDLGNIPPFYFGRIAAYLATNLMIFFDEKIIFWNRKKYFLVSYSLEAEYFPCKRIQQCMKSHFIIFTRSKRFR